MDNSKVYPVSKEICHSQRLVVYESFCFSLASYCLLIVKVVVRTLLSAWSPQLSVHSPVTSALVAPNVIKCSIWCPWLYSWEPHLTHPILLTCIPGALEQCHYLFMLMRFTYESGWEATWRWSKLTTLHPALLQYLRKPYW